jgi:F-type H+-transporting ATPase subunit a
LQDGFYIRLGLWFAITAVSVLAIRRLKRYLRVPKGLRRIVNRVYPALDGLVRSIIGEDGSRFTPIIGCIFVLVMALDLLAFDRKIISPVASTWITAGFALAAFALVQYHEIRMVGLRSYTAEAIGNPYWLFPVKLPMLLVREILKPIVLAMRLLGRVLGEDLLILVLILIAVEVFGNMVFPVGFPMVAFEVVTSFVQAMVFSMLVAVYISAVRGRRVSQGAD